MTTTAKSSPSADVSASPPSNFNETAEDIESIAKQISDHAEAIYQEWRARGLAPTEILKCHPDTDNAFNRTLSPKSSPTTPTNQSRSILDHHKSQQLKQQQPISSELLAKAPDLSNSNLEQLVNSFVNEDKARLAAAQQRSDNPSVSSIKYVLSKFENTKESSPSPPSYNPPPSYQRNSNIAKLQQASHEQPQDIINKTSSTLSNNNNFNYSNKNHPEQQQQQQNHVPDVLKDSIEKTSKRQKPETPAKPEHLLNHVPTWPLKNRIVVQNKGSDMKTPVDKKTTTGVSSSNGQSLIETRATSKSPISVDVMDEVSREEEKLINALKTGTVLTNDVLPEVISSSLNDYKAQAEQQLNGIGAMVRDTGHMLEISSNGNSDGHSTNAPNLQQHNTINPPLKPNHTPIYVPHKEEQQQTKGFSSFTRVATTRIPTRSTQDKTDDKKFEIKSVPSPVRPFLSRGSVAERVLIFEKCPERAPARQTTEKPKIQVSAKCYCANFKLSPRKTHFRPIIVLKLFPQINI